MSTGNPDAPERAGIPGDESEMGRPPQARQRRNQTNRHRPADAGTGPALIYGGHAVLEALRNPRRRLKALYATENAVEAVAAAAAERGLAPTLARPQEIARHAPDGAVHQGLLLIADPLPPVELADLELAGPVIVLDRVTDPHNVGAIIRTAAGFNAACLVTTIRFSPEATGVLAKAASGGLEHLPWARETNLARALEALKDRGFETIGLEGSVPETLAPVDDPSRVALVLGSEGKGLRQKTAATCDRLARIPLPGPIGSLNVSNAAAIALTIATGLGTR